MAILAVGSAAVRRRARSPSLILAGQFLIGVGIGIDFPDERFVCVGNHATLATQPDDGCNNSVAIRRHDRGRDHRRRGILGAPGIDGLAVAAGDRRVVGGDLHVSASVPPREPALAGGKRSAGRSRRSALAPYQYSRIANTFGGFREHADRAGASGETAQVRYSLHPSLPDAHTARHSALANHGHRHLWRGAVHSCHPRSDAFCFRGHWQYHDCACRCRRKRAGRPVPADRFCRGHVGYSAILAEFRCRWLASPEWRSECSC